MNRARWIRRYLAAAMLPAIVAGCKEERRETKLVDVVGTVEKINLSTRTVVVSTYLPKYKREERFVVEVTDETEILLNGSLARLQDIKVGETAAGNVRVVKGEDDNKRYVALTVRVDRAEAITAPGATSDDSTGDAD